MTSTSDGRHNGQTRTYDRADSVVFRKTKEAFGGLSNMAAGFPLEVNGIQIRTSEALYQACRFPMDQEVQEIIINQKSPMTAKMKSKPHRHETRPDWNRVRTKIMRWCLRVKLVQNWEKFSGLLLETGNKPIVEESKKDDFWGAKPLDNGTLKGRNVLGRLLMELREELRSQNQDQFERIEPLDIPDFILFGAAISAVTAPEEEEIHESEFQDAPLFSQQHPRKLSPQESLEPVGSPNATESVADINEAAKETGSTTSIPKECKRLAEVDFPIAEVSRHAVREKSIRHGYPSTLHLWWARRPLASSRAMLLALLWPDPCDSLCPEEFKQKARHLLRQVPGASTDANGQVPSGCTQEDFALRQALLKFIGDFANWDFGSNRSYLEISRALIKVAHGEEPPLVVDPFAGGGSIPLEALRVGCETFASDLNPVACLILKLMLEDIPRIGANFVDDLHGIANEIRSTAETEIKEFYPPDPDGARPVAYFWARTVRCEAPQCGAEIPLMSSFWLSKKATHRRAFRPIVVRKPSATPVLNLELIEPSNEHEVSPGSARNGRAQCPCCGTVIAPKRLQALMQSQRNGIDVQFDTAGQRIGGARLVAVAYTRPGVTGREYRLPSDSDYAAVGAAQRRVREIETANVSSGMTPFPDEPVNPVRPSPNARGLSAVTRYGVKTFSDLFNARQKLSLYELANAIKREAVSDDRNRAAVSELVAAALGKRADYSSGGTRWHLTFEKATCTFSKQALSQTWDYVEPTAVGSTSGSYGAGFETVLRAADTLMAASYLPGQTSIADACHSKLPDASANVWFTDPPYYDAIPYADLSDFFYVWLKRALPSIPRFINGNESEAELTPKREECVWNQSYIVDGKAKDGAFFERCAAGAFAEGRRVLRDDGVGGVVFAHKTTEGWEALLSGLVRGGWVITASWPIATERSGRLQSQGAAALATSVHLICRPRPDDGKIGDWGDVLRELPNRVGDWMERLQSEGIRGADLVFACIGPALEIFSKYSRVETADGREVGLAEYLEKVWEVVGRSALEQVLGTAEAQARNGLAGALEEDARLTALFLWTLQSTNGNAGSNGADNGIEEEGDEAPRGKSKGYGLMFDVARRFAQPLGIHLPDWEGRIIETRKGVVRLMAVTERSKQLFGESGAGALADEIEASPLAAAQFTLFPEETPTVRGRGRRRGRASTVAAGDLEAPLEATTLDRVHAAMLMQASGRSQALRNLLKAEQDCGSDFLRLANALSALYPRGSEEKRLLDAMLLAVPR